MPVTPVVSVEGKCPVCAQIEPAAHMVARNWGVGLDVRCGSTFGIQLGSQLGVGGFEAGDPLHQRRCVDSRCVAGPKCEGTEFDRRDECEGGNDDNESFVVPQTRFMLVLFHAFGPRLKKMCAPMRTFGLPSAALSQDATVPKTL